MKLSKTYFIVSIILLIAGIFLACTGCDSTGFRFAPSEPQKQMAGLSHELAKDVNANGTDPKSPASEMLVETTGATLRYTGGAKTPLNPDQYPTTLAAAESDAARRPTADDVIDTIDKGLGLAEAILLILGGSTGVGLGLSGAATAARFVKELRARTEEAKQQANETLDSFKQVVKAQQDFREKLREYPLHTMTAEETLKSLDTFNDDTQTVVTQMKVKTTKSEL